MRAVQLLAGGILTTLAEMVYANRQRLSRECDRFRGAITEALNLMSEAEQPNGELAIEFWITSFSAHNTANAVGALAAYASSLGERDLNII